MTLVFTDVLHQVWLNFSWLNLNGSDRFENEKDEFIFGEFWFRTEKVTTAFLSSRELDGKHSKHCFGCLSVFRSLLLILVLCLGSAHTQSPATLLKENWCAANDKGSSTENSPSWTSWCVCGGGRRLVVRVSLGKWPGMVDYTLAVSQPLQPGRVRPFSAIIYIETKRGGTRRWKTTVSHWECTQVECHWYPHVACISNLKF